MKRDLRILLLASAALALLHQSREIPASAQGPLHDCITAGDTSTEWGCDAGQTVPPDPDTYLCSNWATTSQVAAECTDCDGGTQSRFWSTTVCGTYLTSSGQTITCGNYSYYVWADDTNYCTGGIGCTPAGAACGLQGQLACCADSTCDPTSGLCVANSPSGGGDGDCDGEDGLFCGSCGSVNCEGECDNPCDTDPPDTDPCATASCIGNVCQNATVYVCCDASGSYYQTIQAYCEYGDDPLIVDLSGSGFPLTNPAAGVYFDFFNTGKPVKIAWTQAGANLGWLAFDMTHSGAINNGWDLFGNVTPQPGPAGTHLGFKALARFDERSFGGNGNGWIDPGDFLYSKVLVWVDRNHNGVAESNELLSLAQAGIQRISLNYADSHFTDAYGNQSVIARSSYWPKAARRRRGSTT